MSSDLAFIVLAHPRASESHEDHLDQLVARIIRRAPNLALIVNAIGWRICADRRQLAIETSRDGSLTILGDAFDRDGRAIDDGRLNALGAKGLSVQQKARWLIEHGWGRYVALLRPAGNNGAACCLRDPTGAIPAYRWIKDDVAVVANEIPRWLVDLLGHKLSPNWSAIGATLGHPTVGTYQSLLDGIDVVPSGALSPLIAGRPTNLWHPRNFAAGATGISQQDAADLLRRQVMLCCSTWARRYPRPLLELSGGLDSAIVLTNLGAAAATAINFTTGFTAGDERHFSRAAAERGAVPLVERRADPEKMNYEALVRALPWATPRLYGLDPQHDDAVAAEARAWRADAIFTGQGGDGQFLYMPSPLIAVDRVRAGCDRQALKMAFTAARRTRCSIWRVLGEILRDRRRRAAAAPLRFESPLMSHKLVAELAESREVHPWLRDLDALPPGKRLHIEVLANGQLFMLPTRRGRIAPLIHPLLSQPLLETCLALPTFVLAPDDRDRGLARDAFAGRVPDSILKRGSKGEASSYVSRSLVANLGLVREWLLDGALVQAGLLDRDALEMTLHEDRLLWADEAGLPPLYLSIEAWARQWLS